MNIPPSAQLRLIVRGSDDQIPVSLLKDSEISASVKTLVRVSKITISRDAEKPHPSSAVIIRGTEFFIPLEGIIDIEAEKARLEKDINRIKGLQKSIQSKLSNHSFITRAPKEIVAREREKEKFNREQIEKLKANLKSLFN